MCMAWVSFHVVIWMGLGSLLSGCGALWKVICTGFIKSEGMSAVLESPTVISSIAKVGKKINKKSNLHNEGARTV